LGSRPRWNNHFVEASPNWIKDNLDGAGNPRQHKTRRKYFSRPQSLPELHRYYSSHPGFHEHREQLKKPEFKRKPTLLSTDRHDTAPEDLCPHRARPAGYMRHPETGERQQWNAAWQTPPTVKSLYQPGTISFKCPGPPPRHLYADLYEDEP